MTYTIALPEGQPKTYTRLADASKFADVKAVALNVELEVVNDESGTVAYLTSSKAIAKRDHGTWFTPWTRLETPKFSAPEIAGFYPAYTRKRIEAVVYRAYDDEAEMPWLVRDGRTGGTQLCANTTESRKLLTAMKQGRML